MNKEHWIILETTLDYTDYAGYHAATTTIYDDFPLLFNTEAYTKGKAEKLNQKYGRTHRYEGVHERDRRAVEIYQGPYLKIGEYLTAGGCRAFVEKFEKCALDGTWAWFGFILYKNNRRKPMSWEIDGTSREGARDYQQYNLVIPGHEVYYELLVSNVGAVISSSEKNTNYINVKSVYDLYVSMHRYEQVIMWCNTVEQPNVFDILYETYLEGGE